MIGFALNWLNFWKVALSWPINDGIKKRASYLEWSSLQSSWPFVKCCSKIISKSLFKLEAHCIDGNVRLFSKCLWNCCLFLCVVCFFSCFCCCSCLVTGDALHESSPFCVCREMNSQASKVFLTSDLCDNRYLCFLVESHQHLRSTTIHNEYLIQTPLACTCVILSRGQIKIVSSIVSTDVWSLLRATTHHSSSLPQSRPSLPKTQSLCR